MPVTPRFMNAFTQSESPPVFLDTTELMILADGRVLVHNLTPEFAEVLRRLDGLPDPSPDRPSGAHSEENLIHPSGT